MTVAGLIRWGLVGALMAGVLALPWLGLSSASLTIACQIGIAVIFAASYHLLFGVCGMLWFAHGIFLGVAGYAVIYLLNGFHGGTIPYFPVSLTPLLGGLFAAMLGALIGWIATAREKLAFAMISLGLVELAVGFGYVFKGISGGEDGLSGDRWVGPAPFGITFGPQRQVYFLIVAWAVACVAAIWFIERTPLGRMAHAVRDNSERIAFLGYNIRIVRWLVFTASAFFAGVAGGLFAINYEQIGLNTMSLEHSALPLLMTVLGGIGSLPGAIAGAALITVLSSKLSALTPAWLLYLGAIFTLVLIYAPNGLAGAWTAHRALWSAGSLPTQLVRPYFVAAAAVGVALCGAVGATEVVFARRTLGTGGVSPFSFGFGVAGGAGLWVAIMVAGIIWMRHALREARSMFGTVLQAAGLTEHRL
jgi:branched-chain amino acid transport system permease protein